MSFSIYFNRKVPTFKGNLIPSTTTNSAFPSQILFQLNNNPYKIPLFHNMNRFVKTCTFTRVVSNPGRVGVTFAELEHEEEYDMMEEMNGQMQRLETLLERIRVLEMDKFMMSRAAKGGEVSEEVREEAETMSRELINKFLEKPMQYLSCKEVNLRDKVKDLKILVEVLESSFLEDKNKKITGNHNSLCLRHLFT